MNKLTLNIFLFFLAGQNAAGTPLKFSVSQILEYSNRTFFAHSLCYHRCNLAINTMKNYKILQTHQVAK